MRDLDISFLKKIYAQVIKGYTLTTFDRQKVYVRHLGIVEQAEIDEKYLEYYDLALSEGVLSEDDRLKELYESGDWNVQKELDVDNSKNMIENLHVTKRGLMLISQIEGINSQIKEEEENIARILNERDALMGYTAEKFATKKTSEIHIYRCMFKDDKFTLPLFDFDEYMELDMHAIDELVHIYLYSLKDINELNLKKIALNQFFQNIYYLCEDNPFYLFGIPIINLTQFQSKLISHAKYFKYILSQEDKPPKELLSDPDGLVDWFNAGQNAGKILADRRVGTVGATSKDLEAMGNKPSEASSQSAQEMMAKSGKKTLSIYDMIDMGKAEE